MPLPAIAAQILMDVVAPELLQYIKAKFESTGQWPTVEELKARNSVRARAIIAEADDILAKIERDQNASGK